MSDYRAATGSGVALGSLTVLDPQPRSIGLQYTRVTTASGGAVIKEGPYIELIWSVFESASEYQSILTVFGLNSAQYATVTIYALNELLSLTRFNGVAVRPTLGQQGAQTNYFLRDVTILVKDLVVAS